MANVAPNAFSNELAQWVRNGCMVSIVLLEFRPKNAARLMSQYNRAFPIHEEPRGGPRTKERRNGCSETRCCTGVVVNNYLGLSILTCAHVLGEAYNADLPITATEINQLFDIAIMCDHQEVLYQNEVEQNPDAERMYMVGSVTHVSCTRDLMLVEVLEQDMFPNCDPHPPIPIAESIPNPLTKVVMLSWPPLASRTAVEGSISNISRPIEAIGQQNVHGYTMRLCEVDITSHDGSSGAPLFNGVGECVGILHGGNTVFSYFISLGDIHEAFLHWGI